MKYKYIVGCVLFFSLRCFAESGQPFFTFGVGGSDLDVDKSAVIGEGSNESGGVYGNLALGYWFSSNVMAELGISKIIDGDIFSFGDTYDVRELSLSLGYAIEINETFSLIPVLGFSRWEFDGKEGLFLNPGPEEKINQSGSDAFLGIRGNFRLSDTFDIYVGYTYKDYDFGDLNIGQMGFGFRF